MDEDIKKWIFKYGLNCFAGQIWIYPTNRPVRDYQFEIVKTALFNNTLVTLPTGIEIEIT